MDAKVNQKVVPISPEDLVYIEEDIKPKNRKGLTYFSLFFLVFTVLAPLLPGRNIHVRSFSTADYFSGLSFYGAFAVLIIGYLYYKSSYCLNQDIKAGEKLVLELKVIRKGKNRYAQNELIVERPKAPSFDKILLTKDSSSEWNSGDIAVIEVLAKSGTVLSYEKC